MRENFFHTYIHTYRQMAMTTATFWAFTINNPDENDYALVRNGYPDYVRSLIHTSEVGDEGTPHIQGWLKLQKQQRLSFVKKLFPKAHFTPLTREEHERNTRDYVQKNDATTAGAHIQQYNDPIPDCVSILKRFCVRYIESSRPMDAQTYDMVNFFRHCRQYESEAVIEQPYNAKIFVSPTYTRIKKGYCEEFLQHVVNNAARLLQREADDASHTDDSEAQTEDAQEGPDDDAYGPQEEAECGPSSDEGDSTGDEPEYGDEVCSGDDTEFDDASQ